jgi:hypothetical protein
MFKTGITVIGMASMASAEKAGLSFGIDHEFIQYGTEVVGPEIVDAINSIQIADYVFDGGYLKNISLDFDAGKPEDLAINFKPEDQALALTLAGVTGKIKGEYEVCQLLYICLWGNFEMDLKKNGFRVNTDLDIGQMTATNGKMVPKMSLENFKADLSSDDLEIKLDGSFNALVSSLVAEVAEWILLPTVMQEVNANVPTMWNSSFNQMMMASGGVLDLGMYDIAVDLSYATAPAISAEHMQLYLNGTVFNATSGELEPHDNVPDMKVDLNTTESVQVGIAEQTINAITKFVHESNTLDITLQNSDLPSLLNTTVMEQYIDGFVKVYGDNEPLEMRLKSFQAPWVSIKDGSFGAKMYFDISFMCKGEEAIAIRTSDFQTVLDVDLKNFVLTVQLDTVYIDTMKELRSKIGAHHEQALADFVDTSAWLVIPVINTYIPSITVPKTIAGDLQLKELNLTAFKGYAYFTAGIEMAKGWAERFRERAQELSLVNAME